MMMLLRKIGYRDRDVVTRGGSARKHLGYILGLVGWCLVSSATPTQAQPPTPIGRVVVLEGNVIRRQAVSTTSEQLSVQQPVYQGDQIRTRPAAKVKLLLVDGTELTLGPESALRLTEYVYSPQAPSQKSVVQMFFGTFRAVV